MVGGLDPRYEKLGGGGGGGGGLLRDEGEIHFIEGRLYYLLNSARFTIDY